MKSYEISITDRASNWLGDDIVQASNIRSALNKAVKFALDGNWTDTDPNEPIKVIAKNVSNSAEWASKWMLDDGTPVDAGTIIYL